MADILLETEEAVSISLPIEKDRPVHTTELLLDGIPLYPLS